MDGRTDNSDQEKSGSWLKKRLFPLLMLLLIILFSFAIFYLYRQYPNRFADLEGFGYLGAFLISLILNATVILPAGSFLIVSALGATLALPVVVGLVAGTGAAIGELTGYIAGYNGQRVFPKGQMYLRVEGWVQRWGVLAIFFLSLAPLVFDLAGLAAGALRVSLWKFLLACWLGRIVFYVAVAVLGAPWWEALLRWFG